MLAALVERRAQSLGWTIARFLLFRNKQGKTRHIDVSIHYSQLNFSYLGGYVDLFVKRES